MVKQPTLDKGTLINKSMGIYGSEIFVHCCWLALCLILDIVVWIRIKLSKCKCVNFRFVIGIFLFLLPFFPQPYECDGMRYHLQKNRPNCFDNNKDAVIPLEILLSNSVNSSNELSQH